MAPVVYVVIPVQDRIDFLGAALASVREQTVTDLEVIVVDSGSTQDVGSFVRHIQRSDSRFRFIRSDVRLGSADARNLGLQEVRAPYIAHLDSDDIMRANRLSLQLAVMAATDVECVAGCMLGMNVAGLRPTPGAQLGSPDKGTPLSDLQVRWWFPFVMPSMSSTLMMRTSTLRDVGGFATDHSTCDDYPTMERMLDRGKVVRIGEFVTCYRHHDRQISTSRNIEQQVQLSLLRQRIMASRVGFDVPLGTVMALTLAGVPESTREKYRASACSLLDALFDKFLLDHQPTDAELEWIIKDHAERRGKLLKEPAQS